MYQFQYRQQPELVTIKVSELDERVRATFLFLSPTRPTIFLLQAKIHDIFDTSSFLRSKLFAANGYILDNAVIEKRFRRDEE